MRCGDGGRRAETGGEKRDDLDDSDERRSERKGTYNLLVEDRPLEKCSRECDDKRPRSNGCRI